ncbi:MAG: glycosyltransferase, partial [Owenweeksia sp.]
FTHNGEIPATVPVHFISPVRGLNPRNLFRVWKRELPAILDQVKPDIVHAHFSLAAFILAITKTPAQKWISLHGVYHLADRSWKGRIIGALEKIAIRKADRVEVLNRSDYEELKHHSKVVQIPVPGVGVDTSKFNFASLNQERLLEIKRELGIEEGDRVLLYVGRYTSFKGYPVFTEAATKFATHNKLKFISCGLPDKIHGRHESPQTDNLIDVGWSNEIEYYMALSHLLLFPSQREGLPVTIMEALSMELPVLAFNTRGVTDLIEHENNGFLAGEQTDEAYLQHLNYLLTNPQEVENVKLNLRESSRERLDSSNFVRWQERAYLGKL